MTNPRPMWDDETPTQINPGPTRGADVVNWGAQRPDQEPPVWWVRFVALVGAAGLGFVIGATAVEVVAWLTVGEV